MKPLIDQHGRAITSLRVSITDRCNLRCQYCMPAEGLDFNPASRILTFEEIVRVVRVAALMGVTGVRITGGEPLLRRNVPTLVRMIKAETAVQNVAMTTNALRLDRFAEPLKEAGLDRINVSCDSLDPERFARITRFQQLEAVWRGIDVAAAVGLTPIRVNTLLLQGFNDDEVDQWVELTRERAIDVRFMELMPIGEGVQQLGRYKNVSETRDALIARHGLEPASAAVGNGPAKYWRAPGAPGLIGFIAPVSDRYCDTCSRMRLTSTGDLRPCLADDRHTSILEAIRAGDDQEIEAGLRRAAAFKSEGHQWHRGATTRSGMSELGG